MNKHRGLSITAIIIIAVAASYATFTNWHKTSTPTPDQTATSTVPSGFKAYTDSAFGFSFQYPEGTTVEEGAALLDAGNSTEFPGATIVKSIQVGEDGGVTVYEVASPGATITDEPNLHASPIPQTKLFWDASMNMWMVAYPEGRDGEAAATTTAVATGKTDSGLSVFKTGRRFDTIIIPLSPNKFVVVSSGGGGVVEDVAKTVRKISP